MYDNDSESYKCHMIHRAASTLGSLDKDKRYVSDVYTLSERIAYLEGELQKANNVIEQRKYDPSSQQALEVIDGIVKILKDKCPEILARYIPGPSVG